MNDNVLLIDADSKIPNLALMKIAQYHKGLGDNVGFNVINPNRVYMSIIFKDHSHMADGLKFFYPEAELDIGGGGYDLMKTLPPEIEAQSPDYDIYPDNDEYIGFTTRGCIRRCYFCIVHKKEGNFRRLFKTPEEALETITNHFQNNYKKIQFLDNNILADKAWFMELTEHIKTTGLKIDFNQGLDVRLMDQEIADRIAELRPIRCWKFAFDSMEVKDEVLRGIDMLKKAHIDTKNKVLFYTYCHNDAQVWDTVERCRILKDHQTTPYIMVNRDAEQTPLLKKLKHWSRPWCVWACDFAEYKGVTSPEEEAQP